MKSQKYDLVFSEELILEHCRPIETERIPVVNAAGRILAKDLKGEPRTDEKGSMLCAKAQGVLVQKGNRIKPIVHGALVSLGVDEVEVYRKPLIGFYLLESAVQAAGSEAEREKLNRHILGNALKSVEFASIYQGKVPLGSKEIAASIRASAAVYDAIIICGGDGTDEFSHMQDVLEMSGADVIIHSVDMQPGGTICVGFFEQVPVFGVTGDPASILTDLYLIILPVLKKIAGRCEEAHDKIMVELHQDFPEQNESTCILLGRLSYTDGVVRMHTDDYLSNGSIWSLQDVDVCAIIPPGSGPLKKGTLLNAYRIIR